MNLKALFEKRNNLVDEMEKLVAVAETRAFNEDETRKFDEIKSEIDKIDKTVKAVDESRDFKAVENKNSKEETAEEVEKREFADFINGKITEMRTAQNISMANNGAVIPTTIAKQIIKKVTDICPILQGATIYNVKGTLKIPVWGKANDGTTDHDITVGWAKEFTELTADSGKFTSVDLSGYLLGVLTLIGKSVINNADIDVVGFVINQMAEEIAIWVEKQLLTSTGTYTVSGTTEYCSTGALSTTNTMNAGSTSTISADNLIDLQAKVKQAFQANACWTMHPSTFAMLKKLKDGNGKYIIQDDFTGDFPFRILGKPVYLSDNMPTVASGAKAVLYGDYSGLAVNIRENLSIEILREKYATMHAIGINAWMEMDSKVIDNQKLATLVMSA